MLGFITNRTTNKNQQEESNVRIASLEKELEFYKKALSSIDEVSSKICDGDFDYRITDWDEHGELSQVMSNINQMIDLTDAFIRESVASLKSAGEGEYFRQFLPQGMSGAYGQGAITINTTINNMESLKKQQKEQRTELTNKFEDTVLSVVTGLTSSAEQFNVSAKKLIDEASLTQELTSNVSKSSNEAATNIENVASSAEKLSSSIVEIANQVNNSASKTTYAKTQVDEALGNIGELYEASSAINEVVELIHSVAKQTNLLALNATIEAARAGEAGKGFAVVASEVKNLSTKTAEATDKIKQQVDEIQVKTKASVNKVKEIAETVENLDSIASAITASTDEQSQATAEISRSIQEASMGKRDVTENISQVFDTANDTLNCANELLEAAENVKNKTSDLNTQSLEFVEGVKNM